MQQSTSSGAMVDLKAHLSEAEVERFLSAVAGAAGPVRIEQAPGSGAAERPPEDEPDPPVAG